ncbi:pyruvate dehydrogenase E2 component (dihydrolipoamide acetyltransferase) [Seinonella peptonophila]|uniref:Dihydrolipoamide acetyltransferase component of pyruvate dehydrogenase complex n=2 Tax=Seinonella peptonophila TaxID=112248 RepID=A0A1M4WDS1_9BACL|nr:pyruvate dehydrogenase E2 component (dihydrolipoamide acetyltransferase) [Seinonella peptonophila]
MPKLGMTMETGTIIQWIAHEGDQVEVGDLLLEVMTDKINIEVEAYESGTLLKVYYEEGTEVPVNQVIAYIGEAEEKVPDQPPSLDGSEAADVSDQTGTVESLTPVEIEQTNTPQLNKPRATPAARKWAREHNLQLSDVEGSGRLGRIHVEDVRKHLESLQQKQPKAIAVEASESPTVTKMSGIRQTIGRRMLESVQQIPHVTLHSEVDMGESMQLRKALLPKIEEKTGYRLSYTEIIMKAAAIAMRHHPDIRSTLDGSQITTHEAIHIALAVSDSKGLMVPVIRNVDQLGLAELTKETKSKAKEVREGRLTPDAMTGGLFTVSNLGMYRVDRFTPIINQPQAAILGVGTITEKPAAWRGEIVLRPRMALSLSFDHRLMDGAPAAAFLTELVEILENPFQLLM